MRSANIKNLSIALENLNRFQASYTISSGVQQLLEKEIELMKEDQHPPLIYTPTKPTPQNTQDEIPF